MIRVLNSALGTRASASARKSIKMVLPERIVRAATRASFVLGDGDHISAWLESEVLRLLILAQRRRAILTAPTRHDGQYIRSLGFLVRCPPEIAWQILGYWRCQYPVDTQLIDQLGFR